MADQGRVLPLKTETAAYQGNSTIKVWVSFDPSSLRLNLNGDVIAGSYGLVEGDDPLDINNTLEKFDYSFGTGGVVGFKLRLINPSTALEEELTRIYEYLYEKGDPAREYGDSSQEKKVAPAFPTFYIRWGYGTKPEDGISSIHAAKLVDIKYRLNSKRERIAELTLMDPFSYAGESTLNPIAQEGLSADAFLYDQRTNKLKLPSRLIGELFSDFAESFPEIAFYTDLDGGDVGKGLDASLYEILAAISEYDGDVLAKLQRGESLEDPIVTESFSQEERTAIEEAIQTQQDPKQFLESLADQSRANNVGVIVLAYKLLFTRLGFNLLYQRVVKEPDFPDQPAEIQFASTSAEEKSLREDENQYAIKKAEISVESEAFISIKDDPGGFRPATSKDITNIQTQLGITYDRLPAYVDFPRGVNPYEAIKRSGIWVEYKNYNSNPGVFELVDGEYTPYLFPRGSRPGYGYAELTQEGLSKVRSQLTVNREAYYVEETQEEKLEGRVPLPEDSKILETDRKIYKVIYDSDQNETVLQGLQKVLTNINTLLVDRINKVWYSFVDFNTLNETTLTTLVTGDAAAAGKDPVATYFNKLGVPKEEFKNNIGIVLIMDEASLRRDSLSGDTKRVLSFPEITTDATLSEGADSSRDITSNEIIYLDVAAKDSVVVDLSFTGDQRVLASLARVPYMTRQAKQFQDLFKSPAESYDVINFLLDQGLEEQGEVREEIRRKRASESAIKESSREIYDEEIQKLLIPYLRILLKDSEKLSAFREYFTLREQGSGKTPSFSDRVDEEFISNLLSILESKTLLDKLFPLNKKSIRSYYKVNGTTIARETDPLELTREIKIFEGLSKNQNPLTSFIKDTVIAAQNLSNEAWKVDVVTLGIPELDLPPQELSSRVVVLNVWDERTQSLHWLSGVYQILGLAHAIDPSRGYLTKLKLFKGVL